MLVHIRRTLTALAVAGLVGGAFFNTAVATTDSTFSQAAALADSYHTALMEQSEAHSQALRAAADAMFEAVERQQRLIDPWGAAQRDAFDNFVKFQDQSRDAYNQARDQWLDYVHENMIPPWIRYQRDFFDARQQATEQWFDAQRQHQEQWALAQQKAMMDHSLNMQKWMLNQQLWQMQAVSVPLMPVVPAYVHPYALF